MAPRQYAIAAGERTVVVERRGGSIPRNYQLISTRSDGGTVGGTIEIQGSRWLFRKDPIVVPLEPEVEAYKGFWDTLFRVTVTPDQDVIVIVR